MFRCDKKLKRIARDAGLKTTFKSGTKLQDILCAKNKTKVDPRERNGIYALTCQCGKKYVGKTKRKIRTRMKEHQRAYVNGNWTHSGIVAHKETCPLNVDWENPEILDSLRGKNKSQLDYNLRLRESLHIAKEDTGPGCGLNEDWGGYLKSRAWLPIFQKMC